MAFIPYDESFINDLLKCGNISCKKRCDESNLPRLLPCCFKTVCSYCAHSLEKEARKKKYKCILCDVDHDMPLEGLPVDERMAGLIKQKPRKICRGPAAESLKANHANLEELRQKLSYEVNNGSSTIDEVCNAQVELIKLTKDEYIKSISEHVDSLIQTVNEFKTECKQNYANMDGVKTKAKEIIDRTDAKIKNQKAYLKQVKIYEEEIDELNEEILKLKKRIEKERLNFKKTLFSNKMLKFVTGGAQIEDIKLMRHLLTLRLSTLLRRYF